MAIVISPIIGLQAWQVGVPNAYLPSATPAPVSWAASGLPPGLSLNSSTGLISGIPTQGGVFVVTLQALGASHTAPTTGATSALSAVVEIGDTSVLNAGDLVSGTGVPTGAFVQSITDGTHFVLSTPSAAGISNDVTLTFTPNTYGAPFAIGVEISTVVPGWSVELDVDWDAETVSSPAASVAAAAAPPAAAASASGPTLYGETVAPLLYGNIGDQLLVNIAIQKTGINQDVEVASIVLAGKESEDAQACCILSDGNFVKSGAGASALYQILVYLDPDLLEGPLNDAPEQFIGANELLTNNVLYVVAEIRIGILQPPLTGGDPVTVYRTSRKFIVCVEQGLANP